MNDYLSLMIEQHRRTGVVPDSNLLLLLFVGRFDRTLVGRFKRLNTFTTDDLVLLEALLSQFSTVATTPNILTEVSNLSGQLPGNFRQDCFASFAQQLTFLGMKEEYVPSHQACSVPHFARFGLTDCALGEIGRGGYLVITTDFPLSQFLPSIGVSVLNFNQIRPHAWRRLLH